MMKAFETWSPRIRRLIYDSLRQDSGCQDIDGHDFFASLGFERICTIEHDALNPIFNASERISYARGPVNTGDALTNVSGSKFVYRLETDDGVSERILFLQASYPAKVYGYWISYPVDSGVYNIEFGIGPAPDDRLTWVEGVTDIHPVTQIRYNIGKEVVGNNVILSGFFDFPAGSSGEFTIVIDRPKKPWNTLWAAWWATAGIRVGKYASITLPADGLGAPSGLFPTLSGAPGKVTLGFTPNDLLGLAIQYNATTIQIKWFKDETGIYGYESFPGVSPVLFGNALLYRSEDAAEADLVLYYLHPAIPLAIFARFQREGFLVEHVINDALTTPLVSLISSEAIEGRQYLYARDSLGRDVTLRSPLYSLQADDDKETIALAVASGDYADSAKAANTGTHPAKLSVAVESGAYSDVIVKPATDLSGDKQALTLVIQSGSYD